MFDNKKVAFKYRRCTNCYILLLLKSSSRLSTLYPTSEHGLGLKSIKKYLIAIKVWKKLSGFISHMKWNKLQSVNKQKADFEAYYCWNIQRNCVNSHLPAKKTEASVGYQCRPESYLSLIEKKESL